MESFVSIIDIYPLPVSNRQRINVFFVSIFECLFDILYVLEISEEPVYLKYFILTSEGTP